MLNLALSSFVFTGPVLYCSFLLIFHFIFPFLPLPFSLILFLSIDISFGIPECCQLSSKTFHSRLHPSSLIFYRMESLFFRSFSLFITPNKNPFISIHLYLYEAKSNLLPTITARAVGYLCSL